MDADTVARALDELNGCELLDTGPSEAGATGTTRREASIKLAKVGGAVAAAPLIVSLALPATAAATVTPAFCTNGGQSHGCGVDCMAATAAAAARGAPSSGRLCARATPSAACPRTGASQGTFGSGAHCSDTAPCP